MFALTRRGANNPDALKLLLHLTAAEQQLLEARNGCVPVRRSVMRKLQSEADADNRARLGMLDEVIAQHILVPPKFAAYPEVEDVLWHTVQQVMIGQLNVDAGLQLMRAQIKQIVERTREGQR